VGDEDCIAAQDLVIAVDGSGSVGENGFVVLRAFVARLVGHYRSAFRGGAAARLGVVLFGNGELRPDGTMAPAKRVVSITSNISKVKEGVEAMKWPGGLTNLAQALAGAQQLLQGVSEHPDQEPRRSAVLVLAGGRPLAETDAGDVADRLKDAGVALFVVPVSGPPSEEEVWQRLASQPSQSHLQVSPGGLEGLQTDPDALAAFIATKFCPKAVSPSLALLQGRKLGFLRAAQGGICGPKGTVLARHVRGPKECASLARAAGAQSFALGRQFRRGSCLAGALAVDAETWSQLVADEAVPSCALEHNSMYDFYGLMPS